MTELRFASFGLLCTTCEPTSLKPLLSQLTAFYFPRRSGIVCISNVNDLQSASKPTLDPL